MEPNKEALAVAVETVKQDVSDADSWTFQSITYSAVKAYLDALPKPDNAELVERLREDADMLRDGLRLGDLTEEWHDTVMKDASINVIAAANALERQEGVRDDWLLPADVKVGATTIGAGCKFSTLVDCLKRNEKYVRSTLRNEVIDECVARIALLLNYSRGEKINKTHICRAISVAVKDLRALKTNGDD